MCKKVRILLIVAILITFVTTSLGLTIIVVESIKLNTTSITISVGKTYKLKVSFTPENATNKNVVFSSENKSIATVDKNGLIKGISPGKTGITAISNNKKKASCNVTVAAGSSQVTPPGTFPVYKGAPITFTIFNQAGDDRSYDYKDNSFTRYITDRTGVNLKFNTVFVNSSEKFNLMIASQDLPDIFFTADLNPAVQVIYGGEGVLIDVEDLLKKYGYYFKKNVLPYRPKTLDTYRMSDGHVYCVPKVMGAYEVFYQQFALINTTWLKKLGLKMPTTTKEFKDILMAFKTKDPNGNGKADEIPMIGYGNDVRSIWGFPMLSYIYHDGSWSTLINRDGNEIFPAFTQNGWKNGLKYMKDLYDNGLIYPASFTYTDGSEVKMLSAQQDTLIGVYTAKGKHHVMDSTLKRVNDYEYLPPLAGPDGVRRMTYNPDDFNVGDAYFNVSITKACKYPEIAIRFLDTFYDKDVSMSQLYGVKGEDWREGKQGEYGVNGKPATWKPIKQIWGTVNNRSWLMSGPTFFPWGMRYGEVYDPASTTYSAGNSMYLAAKNIYSQYAEKKSHFYNDLLFPPKDTEEAVRLKTDIYSYVIQSIARFVTGEINIEAGWKDYLKNLDNFGLERWMKMQIDAAKTKHGEKFTYRKNN